MTDFQKFWTLFEGDSDFELWVKEEHSDIYENYIIVEVRGTLIFVFDRENEQFKYVSKNW